MIELMIVIVILVMLSALLLSGINKVLVYVDEVRTTSEVSKLSEACETFRLDFGLYPPSRITFSERDSSLMDAYSIQYLNRLFPGIDLDLFITSGGTQWHDWNGNGAADANPYTLAGNECLVHFLGGPTYSSIGSTIPLGWHTDKTNPTRPPSATASRLGPFYEFNAARLSVTPDLPGLTGWDATRNVWRGYNDPYGTPYAYFLASDLSMNNYRGFLTRFGEVNDCAPLCGGNFMPYFASPPGPIVPSMGTPQPNLIKFHRSDKFQIISAGRDRRFGQGGHYNQADPQASLWNPLSGIAPDQGRAGNPALADRVSDDYDNVTNFSEGKLVQ